MASNVYIGKGAAQTEGHRIYIFPGKGALHFLQDTENHKKI